MRSQPVIVKLLSLPISPRLSLASSSLPPHLQSVPPPISSLPPFTTPTPFIHTCKLGLIGVNRRPQGLHVERPHRHQFMRPDQRDDICAHTVSRGSKGREEGVEQRKEGRQTRDVSPALAPAKRNQASMPLLAVTVPSCLHGTRKRASARACARMQIHARKYTHANTRMQIHAPT